MFTVFQTFRDQNLEDRFRDANLPDDLHRSRAALAILLLLVAALTPVDLLLFSVGPLLWTLLTARVLLLVVGGVLWIALARPIEARRYDALILTWSLMLAIVIVLAGATRPADHMVHFGFEALAVVAFYLVFPSAIYREAVPALVLTAGVFVAWHDGPASVLLGMTALQGTAQVFGVSASLELHRRRRKAWIAFEREAALRSQLETALGEIRTLRGTVPICAYCKRIRDDANEWQPVEIFVGDHTHARFTHGICPACEAAFEGS